MSDESGIDGRFIAVALVAGPLSTIKSLNRATRDALQDAGCSEIKWKDIDDGRRRRAAETSVTAFLDCPDSRALVLCWDQHDSRRQVLRRDDTADYHRMLFHGLRAMADWWGDREFHWYHDQQQRLDQAELKNFLSNTRGYRSLRDYDHDLFRERRHALRFAKAEQRCSRDAPLIGVADFLAGAVRHSVEHSEACLLALRNSGGQFGLELEEVSDGPTLSRAEEAKAEMVAWFWQQCRSRKLGVSLGSTRRLETRRRGDKLWIWHYEPQGNYDKAPTKPSRVLTR